MSSKRGSKMRRTGTVPGKTRVLSSRSSSSGRPTIVEKTTLGVRGMEEYRRKKELEVRNRLQSKRRLNEDIFGADYSPVDMSSAEREALEKLQRVAEDDDFDAGGSSTFNMADILDGSERIDISHAGGEFSALQEDLEEEEEGSLEEEEGDDTSKKRRKCVRYSFNFHSYIN